MTDEERQEIVRNLRNYHPSRVGNWTFTRAADEIERLAERLEAAHGYADECEDRIKMLNDQIDTMMRAQGER